MVKQKLVEEVHLYCSPLELEEFIQHFCSSFIQKFHEIADLSTFSVEKSRMTTICLAKTQVKAILKIAKIMF